MEVIEFTKDEINERIKTAQENLKTAGMSGMLITNKYNVYYYSGYRCVGYEFSYTRSNFLFIPQSGKPVMLVHMFMEQDAKAASMDTCEVRMFPSLKGPSLEELEDAARACHMLSGKVGMEYGAEQRIDFEINLLHAMEQQFTDVEFVDAADLIWKQRMYKSEAEAMCVQRACEATSYAFDRIFDRIYEGMTEAEVCRMMKMLMLEGGADDLKGCIVCIGKENYPRISKAIGGNRKVKRGDFVWIDAQADYRWYSSDFCRAGVVGEISEERNKKQDLIHKITMTVVDSLEPGKTTTEITKYCREQFVKAGFDTSFDCGRIGHGVGLLTTELPSVTIEDGTELKPGMIITIEPGIVDETGVYDIEENILITETGHKVLSGSSRKLHRIA